MTGSSGSRACAHRSSSSPSTPSIFRSVTTIPGKSALSLPMTDVALSCTSSWKPASSSHCVTAWRIEASSSTNRTGARSGMSRFLQRDGFRHQARKLDHDLGAALRTIGGTNAAAKILNDAVADGKPKPQTLSDRLRRNEGIENALDQL